jgi:hypothetical protein
MKKFFAALAAALLVMPIMVWNGLRWVLSPPPLPPSPVECEADDELAQVETERNALIGIDKGGKPKPSLLMMRDLAAERSLSTPPDLSSIPENVLGWWNSLSRLQRIAVEKAGIVALESHLDNKRLIKGLPRVLDGAEYQAHVRALKAQRDDDAEMAMSVIQELLGSGEMLQPAGV